jgi:hypothetical protein
MVEHFALHHFNAIIASITALALALLGYWFYKKQVKFAWLHKEQASAIVEMYRLLKRTHAAFNVLLSPVQMDGSPEAENKRLLNAWNAGINAFRFFDENEVFFTKDIVSKFRKLQAEYGRLLSPMLAAGAVPKGLELGKAWNNLASLDPLLSELKQTIQQMLG